MRKRKWNLAVLMGFCFWSGMFLLFSSPITAGVNSGDPLWQKAVEMVSVNRNLIPGNAEVRTEELDSKGKLINLHESLIRFFPGKDDQVESEIIKVLKNGEDITDSQKQNQAQQSKGSSNKRESFSLNLWEDYPFGANLQPGLKPLNNPELIQGKRCQVYEYSFRKQNNTTYRGTAWLEEATGIPVQLHYTSDPLPQYISRMVTTVIFASPREGVLYPVEIRVEGAGGILFLKRNFRMTMKLSEFWKQEFQERAE